MQTQKRWNNMRRQAPAPEWLGIRAPVRLDQASHGHWRNPVIATAVVAALAVWCGWNRVLRQKQAGAE
jgi:anti-sigma-K factor RskA